MRPRGYTMDKPVCLCKQPPPVLLGTVYLLPNEDYTDATISTDPEEVGILHVLH